jgi:predicted ATPase
MAADARIKGPAACFPSIEKTYGKPISHWMKMLDAMRDCKHMEMVASQFIIATHSPILLAYPNAKSIRFDEDGVAEAAYEDLEHFALTRDFLNHYPRRLEQLLVDDEADD